MGSGDHAFYFELRHTASLIFGTPLILTSTPFWLVFSTYIDHSISVPAASQGEGEGYWINIDSKTLQITIVVHYISRQNLTWNKYLGLKALSKVHWKPKDLHLVCFSSFTIRDGSNICFREDRWLGNASLREQYIHPYTMLFIIKNNKIAHVLGSFLPNLPCGQDLVCHRLTTWVPWREVDYDATIWRAWRVVMEATPKNGADGLESSPGQPPPSRYLYWSCVTIYLMRFSVYMLYTVVGCKFFLFLQCNLLSLTWAHFIENVALGIYYAIWTGLKQLTKICSSSLDPNPDMWPSFLKLRCTYRCQTLLYLFISHSTLSEIMWPEKWVGTLTLGGKAWKPMVASYILFE
jgi:hypothetical protein